MTIGDISLRLAGLSGGSALFLHNKTTGQYINYANKGVDLADNSPITPLTPFRIASNTKTFTAAANSAFMGNAATRIRSFDIPISPAKI